MNKDPEYRKLVKALVDEGLILADLRDNTPGSPKIPGQMKKCEAALKAVTDYEKSKGFKR